jgi:hypothetical protein
MLANPDVLFAVCADCKSTDYFPNSVSQVQKVVLSSDLLFKVAMIESINITVDRFL